MSTLIILFVKYSTITLIIMFIHSSIIIVIIIALIIISILKYNGSEHLLLLHIILNTQNEHYMTELYYAYS